MVELLNEIEKTAAKINALPDGKNKNDTIQHLKRLKRKLRLMQRTV